MLDYIPSSVIALALSTLVGVVLGGDKSQDKGKDEKGKSIILTEKDNDTKVKLQRGETLVLKLKVQGGTGFSWQVGKSDEDKLKPLGKPAFEKPDKVIPGGSVTQVFRFEAVAPGSVRLEMWYKRPFEKDVKPAKAFAVTVDID
jgi:predicted secreted protein